MQWAQDRGLQEGKGLPACRVCSEPLRDQDTCDIRVALPGVGARDPCKVVFDLLVPNDLAPLCRQPPEMSEKQPLACSSGGEHRHDAEPQARVTYVEMTIVFEDGCRALTCSRVQFNWD